MALKWNEKAVEASYVVATVFFIFCLHGLSKVETATRGNVIGTIGMLLAIAGTLMLDTVTDYLSCAIFTIAGGIIGAIMVYFVTMVQMPQMVGILNAFGGLAAALEGFSTIAEPPKQTGYELVVVEAFVSLGEVIGMITFVGSVVACVKLLEWVPSRSLRLPLHNVWNVLIVISWLGCAIALSVVPDVYSKMVLLGIMFLTASIVGVTFVLAIGGADMPVAISFLNSMSGCSGCTAGFMLQNSLLIITGAFVGASGWILSVVMCRGMNRTVSNVLFGTWGANVGTGAVKKDAEGPALVAVPTNVVDAAETLMNANRVVIVPGYGMAVSQAQGAVSELSRQLRARGVEVVFGIHPVAGRLPGHMNVLLSEANVPYDIVLEMDEVNPDFDHTDVSLVVGANDTVNPSAIEDPTSQIAGMPVIEVWRSKLTIVLKRSMRTGYAGVENPLFFKENTRMLFGDAKANIEELNTIVRKASGGRKGKDVEMKNVADAKAKEKAVEEPVVATGMKIGLVREVRELERRVAIVPETARRLLQMNFRMLVEKGAGQMANCLDDEYRKHGCEILGTTKEVYDQADIIVKVRAPQMHPELGVDEIQLMHKGQYLVSFIWPAQNPELLDRLCERGVTVLAMDQVPRISRAQKLDALSSMSKIAGYRAVIEAANYFGRFFGGEITAAGKLPPAKVLVIGAGVAGLAAVGISHSMGAVVSAFDTRSVVKGEVESMGAKFLEVLVQEDGAGSGGYAKSMSPAFIKAEMELFAAQCREVDMVITTALIPGKKAPVLITKDMVESMAPGSVVVDLAAENGGNCEVTQKDKIIVHHNVTIIGMSDLPSRMPKQSSMMYGRNVYALLDEICSGKADKFALDMKNVVVRGVTVVQEGKKMYPAPPVEVSAPAKPKAEGAQGSPVIVNAGDFDITNAVVIYPMGAILAAMAMLAPDSYVAFLMIFMMSCVIGWKIIWNVAPCLQTPLMSVTNAVSGIVLLGGLVLLSTPVFSISWIFAAVATVVASINVFGGFLVTQKMLLMFKKTDASVDGEHGYKSFDEGN